MITCLIQNVDCGLELWGPATHHITDLARAFQIGTQNQGWMFPAHGEIKANTVSAHYLLGSWKSSKKIIIIESNNRHIIMVNNRIIVIVMLIQNHGKIFKCCIPACFHNILEQRPWNALNFRFVSMQQSNYFVIIAGSILEFMNKPEKPMMKG